MTKKFFQKPIDNINIIWYNIGTVKVRNTKQHKKREVIKNEL